MLITVVKPLIVGALLLVSGPPLPDRSVDKMCSSGPTGAGGGTPTKSCLSDERAARDSLIKRWEQIPEQYRTACLNSINDVAPSFVALDDCITNNIEIGKSHTPSGDSPSGSLPIPKTP